MDYFSQSADNSKHYHDAMVAAFEDSCPSFDLVRKTFAAAVAWHFLYPEAPPYGYEDEKDDKGQILYMMALVSHLHGGSRKSHMEYTRVEDLD